MSSKQNDIFEESTENAQIEFVYSPVKKKTHTNIKVSKVGNVEYSENDFIYNRTKNNHNETTNETIHNETRENVISGDYSKHIDTVVHKDSTNILITKLLTNLFVPNKLNLRLTNKEWLDRKQNLNRNFNREDFKEYLQSNRDIQSQSALKLCYSLILLKHKNKPINLLELFMRNIKQILLGIIYKAEDIKLSNFSSFTIENNKYNVEGLKLEIEEYNCLRYLLRIGFMYKKLKMNFSNVLNKTEETFVNYAIPYINEYERRVMVIDGDLMDIYASIYSESVKIEEIYEEYKKIKNRSFDNVKLMKMHLMALNFYVNFYMENGYVDDKSNEFFIKEGVVDYGLVPKYINNKRAETICYVGMINRKYKSEIISVDFLSNDFYDKLQLNLINANRTVRKYLLPKMNNLFTFINDVFLFRRGDFIDYLFNELKENRNLNKKSLLNIIEEGVEQCGIQNENTIDIKANDNGVLYKCKHYNETVYLEEPFALYCKIDDEYLDGEIISYKLMSIFKFMWKLKKITNLSIRIGSYMELDDNYKKISLFCNYINMYVYYEVINNNLLRIEWDERELAMVELKKQIDVKLDNIINKLFLDRKNNIIEQILCNIEIFYIGIGKNRNSNGIYKQYKEIIDIIGEFNNNYSKEIENSWLKEGITLL